jgi:hypothetical protein
MEERRIGSDGVAEPAAYRIGEVVGGARIEALRWTCRFGGILPHEWFTP